MRHSFGDRIRLNSDWVLLYRIARLSGVCPKWFECCPNSCICYLGEFKDSDTCPECNEPRYSPAGRPRRYFCYIPLIARLQAYFQSLRLIELLQYRSQFVHTSDTIHDIFSSAHYQHLRQTHVVVDGQTLPHRHFSDPRDIAFSLCVDSYLLFQRRRSGPSATPILLQNFNLPPEIRTHLEHLICVAVIGGPKQPKRLDTYLIPFEDECAQLAHGVHTYDALTRHFFPLHAYCIFCSGDILAIQKLLNIRGVNAWVPCRSCRIRGVHMPGQTNYYYPLRHPAPEPGDDSPVQEWDPLNLPKRDHDGMLAATEEMRAAATAKYRTELGKFHGIRCTSKFVPGPTIGLRVQSTLDHARSFPWDWMHLFCENNIPNLVSLWMGRFKGLDDDDEPFVIPARAWVSIAEETSAAVKTIPAEFVGVIPDIIKAREFFTADIWAFWFMYVAPIVLHGRFPDSKYYDHMCALGDIMKATLQFEISRTALELLRNKIVLWVQQYEEYYIVLCKMVNGPSSSQLEFIYAPGHRNSPARTLLGVHLSQASNG